MAQTVVGIFDSASDAQDAVNKLVEEGFARENIDLSAQQTPDTVDTDYTYRREHDKGGIAGFFESLFGGDDYEDERQKYTSVGYRNSIITVHVANNDDAERAADILDDAGAIDVDERSQQYAAGTFTGNANRADYENRANVVDGDQKLKVIEENLEVGKRTVEQGGVRLRSRIIETPVEETVRLREERVRVERNPVNRPATQADLDAFQEGEIELRERTEVPVVNKTANVVEEISLGKEVNEREEVVKDTVRKTDVEVEQLGGTDRLRTTEFYDRTGNLLSEADWDRTDVEHYDKDGNLLTDWQQASQEYYDRAGNRLSASQLASSDVQRYDRQGNQYDANGVRIG